jgi:SET domain-containing protein
MIEILNNIHVKESSIEGLGVFANNAIDSNSVIEYCPMVPLAFRSRYHSDPQIYNYLFSSPHCECKECKNHGYNLYMLLGCGMLYNHNDNHNAEIKFDIQNRTASVIAISPINKDEEIFINYSQKYFLNIKETENTEDAKNN